MSNTAAATEPYDGTVFDMEHNAYVDMCRQNNVACGHPHVDAQNVEQVIDQGCRRLMPKPERTNAAPALGRKLAGR